MTIINVATAKQQVRIDHAFDDAMIELYLDAAERAAADFLNRSLYADEQALATARTGALTEYRAALAEAQADDDAASALDDCHERREGQAAATRRRRAATAAYRATMDGKVMTADIQAAVLLTLGHLFENRSNTVIGISATELPNGALTFLWPHRIGLGV